MPSDKKIVVFTNCASRKEAQKIARELVERRMAACVNVASSPVQSVYRWKGKVETAKEFLLIIKTSRARYDAVERTIQKLHSYDVPEIIALPIATGSRAYLSWLGDSVAVKGKG
jgi:periplasmic divalent cation tolerance protein